MNSQNKGLNAFVPNGDHRRETAAALVTLANDNGLDSSVDIFATGGGFFVSDALADLLYDEDEADDNEPGDTVAPKTTDKASAETAPTKKKRK